MIKYQNPGICKHTAKDWQREKAHILQTLYHSDKGSRIAYKNIRESIGAMQDKMYEENLVSEINIKYALRSSEIPFCHDSDSKEKTKALISSKNKEPGPDGAQ